MECHIAHMYELHRFMGSLALAARRNPTPQNPLHLAKKANQFVSEQRKQMSSRQIADPQISAAAQRLGVSMPPLADCR
jgi:hypothetical protein